MHIQEVDKDALSGLGTQIDVHRCIGTAAHLGLEHEVELAHVGPVAGSAHGIHNLIVHDDLLQFGQVVVIHRLLVTCMQLVTLLLILEHTRVGLAEHRLIELVAEAFGGFLYLLVHLLLDLGDLVLDEHIGAIAFLAVSVINQRVVERPSRWWGA